MKRQVQVGMQIEHDVMFLMRNGSLTATDFYHPDNAGTAPLLLERTPFGKYLSSQSKITSAHSLKAL